MCRLSRLLLGVGLLAPLWSGCQSTRQTAHVEPVRSGSFWSAEGDAAKTNAELVTNRDGAATVRFASRAGQDSGSTFSNLLPTSRSEGRIPLPRTNGGTLRDIETADQNGQPIGAF